MFCFSLTGRGEKNLKQLGTQKVLPVITQDIVIAKDLVMDDAPADDGVSEDGRVLLSATKSRLYSQNALIGITDNLKNCNQFMMYLLFTFILSSALYV